MRNMPMYIIQNTMYFIRADTLPGKIHAVDLTTSQELWSYEMNGKYYIDGIVADRHRIFVFGPSWFGATDFTRTAVDTIVVLEAKTGKLIWETKDIGGDGKLYIYHGGLFCAGKEHGNLLAWDMNSGKPTADIAVPGGWKGDVISMHNGFCFWITVLDCRTMKYPYFHICVANMDKRELLFTAKLILHHDGLRFYLMDENNRLYLGSTSRGTLLIDTFQVNIEHKEAKHLWQYKQDNAPVIAAQPLVIHNNIAWLALENSASICALDAASGSVLKTIKTGANPRGCMLTCLYILDDILYFGFWERSKTVHVGAVDFSKEQHWEKKLDNLEKYSCKAAIHANAKGAVGLTQENSIVLMWHEA